jgi:hypothetical protein
VRVGDDDEGAAEILLHGLLAMDSGLSEVLKPGTALISRKEM